MALLLTLVANIGVALLVGSFRVALNDWLEVRLSANIFIAGDSGESYADLQWVAAGLKAYPQHTAPQRIFPLFELFFSFLLYSLDFFSWRASPR